MQVLPQLRTASNGRITVFPRKLLAGLGTVCLILMGFSGQTFAAHGGVHGYCENGKPMVQEWPDRYKDYHPECAGNSLVIVPNNKLEPPPPLEWMEEPDDFGNWAYVYLNNKRVTNPYRDIDPFVTKSTGRTLIPIRMVTEAMGGTAEWDGANARVTIRLNDQYMTMTIGQTHAIANGSPVKLDQPPLIIRDRTMVPLRVVLEAFGAHVDWVQELHRIDITLDGVECPAAYCPK